MTLCQLLISKIQRRAAFLQWAPRREAGEEGDIYVYRFGVDIGGTFTDLVIQDGETGLIQTLKVPSTPDDPSEAVLNAVRLAASEQSLKIDLGEVVQLIHGTTVASNTILQ